MVREAKVQRSFDFAILKDETQLTVKRNAPVRMMLVVFPMALFGAAAFMGITGGLAARSFEGFKWGFIALIVTGLLYLLAVSKVTDTVTINRDGIIAKDVIAHPSASV